MHQTADQLEPAYVLHTRVFRETSLLIDVLTPKHGLIAVVARGVRSQKNRQRGILQPLQPLMLSWRQNGDLGTLTIVEAAGPPVLLTGEALFCAWYAHELLLKLLSRNDPCPDLFIAYAGLLGQLSLRPGPALRHFEISLLHNLGYALDYPTDLNANCHYQHNRSGGWNTVESGISGALLIALRDGEALTPCMAQVAREITRPLLAQYLGNRSLETPKLFRDLKDVLL